MGGIEESNIGKIQRKKNQPKIKVIFFLLFNILCLRETDTILVCVVKNDFVDENKNNKNVFYFFSFVMIVLRRTSKLCDRARVVPSR